MVRGNARTEPRLVGDNMARRQGRAVREAMGTFVHGQERADSMPSPMLHERGSKLVPPVVNAQKALQHPNVARYSPYS